MISYFPMFSSTNYMTTRKSKWRGWYTKKQSIKL